MGGYKRYDEYKDSGIEWISIIPQSWKVNKVKFQLSNLDYKRIPLSAEERGKMEKKVYDYYGASGIIDKVENYLFDGSYIIVGEDGANLYSRSTPLAFLAKGKFWVNNHAHILKPKNGDLNFFVNILETLDYTIYITGSAQPKLTQANLGNISIPVPPVEEQIKIGNFIRAKTSEIDEVISNKEKLIELLKEKRQAIITEAVTRGINADVKMKDSGVEWIVEIPEHWEVKRLKNISDVKISNVDKKSKDTEEPVLLCNYVDVYYNNEITRDIKFMKATAKKEQIEKFELKKEDILITKDSETPDDIAVAAWVRENLDGVVCGYHLAHIKPNRDIYGKYLFYAFKSSGLRDQYWSNANGVTRFGLSKDKIKNALFFVPNKEEQEEIVDFIENNINDLGWLEEQIGSQILKLKEYKQSLIFEAVTGKIDLRDYEG